MGQYSRGRLVPALVDLHTYIWGLRVIQERSRWPNSFLLNFPYIYSLFFGEHIISVSVQSFQHFFFTFFRETDYWHRAMCSQGQRLLATLESLLLSEGSFRCTESKLLRRLTLHSDLLRNVVQYWETVVQRFEIQHCNVLKYNSQNIPLFTAFSLTFRMFCKFMSHTLWCEGRSNRPQGASSPLATPSPSPTKKKKCNRAWDVKFRNSNTSAQHWIYTS